MLNYILNNKKTLITIGIIVIIIIIGLAVIEIKGLNYGLFYSENVRMNLYVEADFTEDEIRQIAEEILETNNLYIQKGGADENIITITAKQISNEQSTAIVQKVNEKYETELNEEEDLQIINNGKIRGLDIIFPYATPILVSMIAILIYLGIYYKKVGMIKVLGISIGLIIATQLLYLTFIAIFRIPINKLTMPISLLIYFTTVLGITIKFEKLKLEYKKSQNK